jgi:TolB-like protein/lipoprotein NlpI
MRRSLFAELKRRNVFRAAILYIGVVWALSQGAAQLLPVFDVPNWAVRWFIVAAIIGFPFWVAFAWFYEFTPEGLKRESEIDPAESITAHTGRTMDRWIIGVLAVAVVLLLTNTFVWHKGAGLGGEAGNLKFPSNSIAVLPFTNLSPDKNQDYFSEGISEDLLNLLAKVPQLQVTARTSSFYFKGKNLPISEIASRLHVAHVLEGSVEKVGNEVRISVQLVDAGSDTQRWSQTWDRTFDDIFKIQDQVATAVVTALKVKLIGTAPKVRPTDPKAYVLFLQAEALSRQFTPEAFRQSDALLRQVLAMDPRYAPAWNDLGFNFVGEGNSGMIPSLEGRARARKAAEKALAIDPDYAPAYARLGWIAREDDDLAGAAKYYQHALALDPTDPGVLGNSAILLKDLGHPDEALAILKVLVRRNPVDPIWIFDLGLSQRNSGRLDAAIASFHTILSLSPRRGNAHAALGIALLLKGDAPGALTEIEQEPNEAWRMISLPPAYCALGRKAQADRAFTALIDKYEKEDPYNIAYDYAYCGEADKAFEWLDKAVEYKDSGLNEILSENLFDKIHSDPRWLPFLRKIGKAPEQLAEIKFKVSLPKAWQAGLATETSHE